MMAGWKGYIGMCWVGFGNEYGMKYEYIKCDDLDGKIGKLKVPSKDRQVVS